MATNGNVRFCTKCENVNSIETDYCAFCKEPTQRLYEPERLQKSQGKNRPALLGVLMAVPILLLGPTILAIILLAVGLFASILGLRRAKDLKTYSYKKTGKALSVTGVIFHSVYFLLVIFIIVVGTYYGVIQFPLS